LNHLGVEVESSTDVEASADRLKVAGLATFDERDTTCCFALQDKVWVHDSACCIPADSAAQEISISPTH